MVLSCKCTPWAKWLRPPRWGGGIIKVLTEGSLRPWSCQAVHLKVYRWPPTGWNKNGDARRVLSLPWSCTHGAPTGASVAAKGWASRAGGSLPTPIPGGPTQTAPPLAHIPALALPDRPLQGLSLKICSGEGGLVAHTGEGTKRGSRHQSCSRPMVQGGPLFFLLRLFVVFSACIRHARITLGRESQTCSGGKPKWQKQ